MHCCCFFFWFTNNQQWNSCRRKQWKKVQNVPDNPRLMIQDQQMLILNLAICLLFAIQWPHTPITDYSIANLCRALRYQKTFTSCDNFQNNKCSIASKLLQNYRLTKKVLRQIPKVLSTKKIHSKLCLMANWSEFQKKTVAKALDVNFCLQLNRNGLLFKQSSSTSG